MRGALLFITLAAPARASYTVFRAGPMLRQPARARAARPSMDERWPSQPSGEEPATDTDDGSVQLDPTDLVNAARTASGLRGEAEFATRELFDVRPEAAAEPAAKEPFDPRIILYVSLPLLVLGLQIFFTFSRDSLSEAALGPAVMDLWLP